MKRKPDDPIVLSPVAIRNGLAHMLRRSMANGARMNISAGRYSCIGQVVRMENDPKERVPEDGSTLTAFVLPGPDLDLIEVPVGAVTEVKRA